MSQPSKGQIKGSELIKSVIETLGPPPMPFKQGTAEDCLYSGPRDSACLLTRGQMEEKIRAAAVFAFRVSTFYRQLAAGDKDAFASNMVIAMLGYHTPNGLGGEDWMNPPEFRKA